MEVAMTSSVRHDHSVDSAWDFYGCNPDVLSCPHLGKLLHQAVLESGFTPACDPPYQFRSFPGGGASFLEMLEESHIALHGSPENTHCIEVTIHSCYVVGLGDARKPPSEKTRDLFVLLRKLLQPSRVEYLGERIRASANSTVLGVVLSV